MPSADMELFQEAAMEAVDEFLEFIIIVVLESMGQHGEVPGFMWPMTPGDRIAQFVRDAQSGQLDALKDLNTDHYERRVRQYMEDIKNSPFVARTYEG